MKRLIAFFCMLAMCVSGCMSAYAVGDGNVDGGGGGMGSGTSTNKWIPGEEGVRVTVIRTSDGSQVSSSFDMADFALRDNVNNFGIYSKLAYRSGLSITPQAGNYRVVRPTLAMPQIISTGSRQASIDEIKRYFCSEYAVQLVANQTGIEYATLISGDYKILIEPVAYFLFNGNYFAMSAHQAAMYDQILSGGLRSKMVSLSHKNLPLSMFLERPDLGYAAWNGNRTKAVSNNTIINYLGLGIVKFTEEEIITDMEFPEPGDGGGGGMFGFGWLFGAGNAGSPGRYVYRTDTDVITSVRVYADREYNPDNPLTARFVVGGNNYIVRNIVIPESESQLVWIKWHTPSTPQTIIIRVTVGGRTQTINATIEEVRDCEPPDPKANDRNDAFTESPLPTGYESNNLSWGVWSASWHEYWVWASDWEWTGTSWVDNGQWVDEGWYDFTYNMYEARLDIAQSISPDSKVPTTLVSKMKSGYGFKTDLNAQIVTTAPQSAYTQAQNSVMYFPEFGYETYFRVLDRNVSTYRSAFKFKENRFSTYLSRAHFTPIWYPDGAYRTYTEVFDAWTPAGMLKVNKSAEIEIEGNLFSDWHIAPKKY